MEEKKIGIVTLHGYSNYGNRLQNYAMIHTIKKMDFDVYSSVIKMKSSKYIEKKRRKLRMKKVFQNSILNNFKKMYLRIHSTTPSFPIEEKKRKNKFEEFSEKYLFERFYSLENKKDDNNLQKYSFFITGSDQVWSPNAYQKLPIYFLTFTSKEKRISYAPSIGMAEIPKDINNDYKIWLEGMSAVSVREESGSNIINGLTGIDAPVLVDPTMLLTKEEWQNISNRANNRPDTPYILTYFLGGPSDKTRKKIKEIAKKNNMTIINMGDITEKETYETGPSEFLDYIDNASAFFTDSFHGVVFSIIFKTPFIVHERITSGASMYSRIETILEKFNLRTREVKGFNEDIFSMDFSGTQDILEKEYGRSMSFLKKALRVEE